MEMFEVTCCIICLTSVLLKCSFLTIYRLLAIYLLIFYAALYIGYIFV